MQRYVSITSLKIFEYIGYKRRNNYSGEVIGDKWKTIGYNMKHWQTVIGRTKIKSYEDRINKTMIQEEDKEKHSTREKALQYG